MTQFDPGRVLGQVSINSMTVWGALYRKKLIDKINWNDTNYRIYEDNFWTLRFLEHASKGVFTSRVGYLYRFDESIKNVLSKRLTGNSFNGEPVGYMETMNNIWNEFRRYNKKYKIGAESILDEVIRHMILLKSDYITKAGLWNEENNIQYLPLVFKAYEESREAAQGDALHKSSKIQLLEKDNLKLRTELEHFLSIKRSTKLTLGNIKRRLKRQFHL